MSVNVCLPSYSIGADCYKDIAFYTRHFGSKVVVIGGKTAMEKSKDALLEGIADSNLEVLDFIWYGGNSTYENGDDLIANPVVQEADMIFGVGGGRACDTVKYVASEMDKPYCLFPTVGSNCASVTAIGVMYHADGSFKDYYYPQLPVHTFINSQIIAESPAEMLWAGIVDALSKECEAVFSSKNDDLAHTPLMGVQLSKICTEPLLTYGHAAMEACRANTNNHALEQVVLDIIISTGLVSNMTTNMPMYYYNSSLAHCVYYGATVTKNGHKHRHGEIVSLGVLCLLTYDKQYEQRDRLRQFNASMGLPVCFDDIDIDESEFELMADKTVTGDEWKFRSKDITTEGFIACMKEQNAVGRAFKAQQQAAVCE